MGEGLGNLAECSTFLRLMLTQAQQVSSRGPPRPTKCKMVSYVTRAQMLKSENGESLRAAQAI